MLKVKDIMTQPVIVIRSAATVTSAIWLMRAKRVRSLLVEKLQPHPAYGIVTEKDIVYNVVAKGRDPDQIRVADVMRQPCISIPPEATIREAAGLLSEAGIHRAPVMRDDTLLGVISVTDILQKGSLPVPAYDELSLRIEKALQHARIIDDEDAKIQQECDIAWQVLEEIERDKIKRQKVIASP